MAAHGPPVPAWNDPSRARNSHSPPPRPRGLRRRHSDPASSRRDRSFRDRLTPASDPPPRRNRRPPVLELPTVEGG
ncbi:hypothetical protein TVNIR_0506 [Thioalkalivibrio nitratireducens DSM 14787]|uniref:Uncharacterized protein n=1 Tax=Thioalkalivibrio nitratireducens (strain DSM 14787 / UNIQEM 213 / ALEN2) TaxID=1255043 RepID=L0DT75_THIND|nr:hypothetical protein TVNIR_0506 [Thioalkalivibrio nitratireducens DSM 14787]